MTASPSIANPAPATPSAAAHHPFASHVTNELMHGTYWISPALVGVALLMWLASIGVVLTQPLSEPPLYFASRYLVLDATSLQFMAAVYIGLHAPVLSSLPNCVTHCVTN